MLEVSDQRSVGALEVLLDKSTKGLGMIAIFHPCEIFKPVHPRFMKLLWVTHRQSWGKIVISHLSKPILCHRYKTLSCTADTYY